MGQRKHDYYMYILANAKRTALYTGVTNDIARRTYEHKSGHGGYFTKRYRVSRLVYYEHFRYINDAIHREKQLKAGSRQDKLDLIEEHNPEWRDLYLDLIK